jgi:hypothetical protein
MKEDFLHYVWRFKKFDFSNLKTTTNQLVNVINAGQYTQLAGPDFFNSQIEIEGQKWAGNVEIHIKSSDWYVHNHERNNNYDNVILHVVWEHDTEIFRKDNSEIPVLELKNYVSKQILDNYEQLMQPKSWIFCEKQIATVSKFVFQNWQERLFFERLERKAKPIADLLQLSNNNWEAVLFVMLAKNFGLNTNGTIFMDVAQNIPFGIVRKEGFEVENLEALLFGMSGLLETDFEDNYCKDLKFKFLYLLQKHQLERKYVEPVQFFKHRPDNFPTIRLAQLAGLYATHQNLFSKIIQSKSMDDIYKIFEINASDYWQNHYQFDKESPKKRKKLSTSFIDLLVINTIIPFQFAYAKSQNKTISENIIALLQGILAEKNGIVDKFSSFGIKSENAFESQALIQLKNEYCLNSKCLQCAVGTDLLKSKLYLGKVTTKK